MWRPLTDVRDAARAYIVVLEADCELTNGQIYNVVSANYRISELALRIQALFTEMGREATIQSQFQYSGIRNYRVSGGRILRELNFKPLVQLEESVRNMVNKIETLGFTDFESSRYYNIRWMKLLEEAKRIIEITGSVFETPAEDVSVAADKREWE